MVKIGLKSDAGSEVFVEFDEDRIIKENNLRGNYDKSIVDNINNEPTQRNQGKLLNYGAAEWFASGTNFGMVSAGAQILFDFDKNNTQSGSHFTAQGVVRVSGNPPYVLPVGEDVHRLYAKNTLEVIFYNQDNSISGTKTIITPGSK